MSEKMTDAQLVESISLRFKSGNSVPCERAHITANEWGRIAARLTAQQADPWRGLYSPDRMPSDKDEPTHPDLPSYDDDREDSIAPLLKAQGFEWKTITTEFDESVCPNDDAYWQILRGWVPEPPDASYRLAGKYDTEDGPSALFVRPIASPGAQGGGDARNHE